MRQKNQCYGKRFIPVQSVKHHHCKCCHWGCSLSDRLIYLPVWVLKGEGVSASSPSRLASNQSLGYSEPSPSGAKFVFSIELLIKWREEEKPLKGNSPTKCLLWWFLDGGGSWVRTDFVSGPSLTTFCQICWPLLPSIRSNMIQCSQQDRVFHLSKTLPSSPLMNQRTPQGCSADPALWCGLWTSILAALPLPSPAPLQTFTTRLLKDSHH